MLSLNEYINICNLINERGRLECRWYLMIFMLPYRYTLESLYIGRVIYFQVNLNYIKINDNDNELVSQKRLFRPLCTYNLGIESCVWNDP